MQALPHRRHFSMRLSTNSPSDLSHRKQWMTDQPHWSTARTHCTGIKEREHSRHRSTHKGLYLSPVLSKLPCLRINPPCGAFLQQSLSCDSSSRDNILHPVTITYIYKLGWELGPYYASYDDFHPDILARMYT